MANKSNIASGPQNVVESVVEVPYGIFGRPNESQIRKTVGFWRKQGLTVQRREEIPYRKITLLYFMRARTTSSFTFSKLVGYGFMLLIGYFTVRALLGGGGSETTRATPTPRQQVPTAIAAVATSTLEPSSRPTIPTPTAVPLKDSPTRISMPTPTIAAIRTSTPTSTNTPIRTPTPSPTPTFTPTPVPATVLGQEGINVRSCASTTCGVVGVVFSQDEVRVLSSTNDWYAVVLPDGKQGYIWSQLLSLPEGVEIAVLPTHTSTPIQRPTQLSISRNTCTSGLRNLSGFDLYLVIADWIYNYTPLNNPDVDIAMGVGSQAFAGHASTYTFERETGIISGIRVRYGFDPETLGMLFGDLGFDFSIDGCFYSGEVTFVGNRADEPSRTTMMNILRLLVADIGNSR